MDFQESKTKTNLARSFAAECQEGARYQFMAKKAQAEGYEYMSALIRTLAHNEMAHAERFYQEIIKHGGNQTQNIEICAGYPFKDGELEEVLRLEAKNEKMSSESIYPKFADEARDEGFKEVADLFDMISRVEESHEHTLIHLADSLKCNCLYKTKSGEGAFKCDNCGTIILDRMAPKICPLCQMGQGYYRIDFSMWPTTE